MSKTRRYTRQTFDPNGDFVALNERCSVSIMQDRAVVLKEGLRIVGFYDKWPDPDKLKYIRDEFVRVMRDPRNAPDPDWTVLAA
ncbi:hypothetical protein [Hydrogenophaga sp.]|uniref:hypothetical protein n=1 Tax=Hydrogenophaga sp. TaxID=1904254 RepID=UPI0035B4720E